MISIQKLHELYIDTLDEIGVYLLNEDNDTIEYVIFEEFDIGVISFLHIDSLRRLYESNLITENEMESCIELRKITLEIQFSSEWNLEMFRTSPSWRKILILADEIRDNW